MVSLLQVSNTPYCGCLYKYKFIILVFLSVLCFENSFGDFAIDVFTLVINRFRVLDLVIPRLYTKYVRAKTKGKEN